MSDEEMIAMLRRMARDFPDNDLIADRLASLRKEKAELQHRNALLLTQQGHDELTREDMVRVTNLLRFQIDALLKDRERLDFWERIETQKHLFRFGSGGTIRQRIDDIMKEAKP